MRRLGCLFFLLLLWALQQTAKCLKVGLQAPNGADAILKQFNSTFTYLGSQTNMAFELLPFASDADLSQAVMNGSLDLVYGGPTVIYCIIVSSNIQPLTTVISYETGQPSGVLSGSIISLPASNITTPKDLIDRVVGVGELTGLTTFQAELEYLIDEGVSLFTEAKSVVGFPQSFDIAQSVESGLVDAGFVQTGLIESLKAEGLLNNNTVFNIMDAHYYADQPLPSTTITYSSQTLAASVNLNNTLRTSIVETLIGLRTTDPPLVDGDYAGWFVPQSFLTMRRLVEDTGLLPITEASCVSLSALYAAVSCPTGYEKGSDTELTTSCTRQNFSCPLNATFCICSPCMLIKYPVRIGKLSIGAFTGILACLFFLFLAFVTILWRRRLIQVQTLPWEKINFGNLRLFQRRDSGVRPGYILGESQQGYVLKADFHGTAVACKRAYRHRDHASIFDNLRPSEHKTFNTNRWRLCFMGCAEAIGICTKRRRVMLRLEAMKRLQHPRLIRLFGCFTNRDGSEVIAVLQFAERGSLDDLLHNPSIELTTAARAKLALDVAQAISYLHGLDSPIVGIKLRGHHILINGDYSCMVNISVTPKNSSDRTGTGRAVLAPEILNGGDDTQQSDIYAFGMLLYEICHGREAFIDDTRDADALTEALKDVDCDEVVRPNIRDDLQPVLKQLISGCLSKLPHERTTISDIIAILQPMAIESLTDALTLAKDQQQDLLKQMLPDHVRVALLNGQPPPVEEFPLVTTYFSDVVNYTHLSGSQPTRLIMKMMDDLYTKFDELCVLHGMMKIDTAGDSFYAVSGLVHPPLIDHAARAAHFALDCSRAAATVLRAGSDTESVTIRIGLNCGPVISGVVGTTLLPKYSVMGDTVNVGSRMESTGQPGYIQISEMAKDLIVFQDAGLSSRIRKRAGKIQVKGKPDMQTYWLLTDENLALAS